MKDWRHHRVDANASILATIECIDSSPSQIALVVDEHDRLLGTVTDGDVRRAILRGVDLQGPVSSVMKRGCRVMHAEAPMDDVYTAMIAQGIRHMPIVTHEGRVIGLSVLEELISSTRKLSNPVVIMAGGLGTRLRPLTENVPKPMLDVGGKPMLETILSNMVEAGFEQFYISVNYRADLIKSHFGTGERWQARIEYLEENERRGTAGALSLLPHHLSESVLVVNGDVLSKVNYRALLDFHHALNSAATLCIRELSLEIPYGVVDVDDYAVRRIVEKPTQNIFVNAGVYALTPECLSLIPEAGMFDMPQLIQLLLDQDKVISSFPVREYWLDVGRASDFERANQDAATIFATPRHRSE